MRVGFYSELTRDWGETERRVLPEDRVQFHESVDSTNTSLLDEIREGNVEGVSLVVADHQTGGRGRRGDRWEAPPRVNLLFSIALPLEASPQSWSWLPHLSAKLIGESVESILTGGSRVEAKWPNDLYLGGRKFCGILVETISNPEPFAVVGVGLNVNMKRCQFPPEIEATATSLLEWEGCESNRWYLLGLIVRGFLTDYPKALTSTEGIVDWYEERDYLRGRRLRVTSVGRTFEGVGQGLGSQGELLLEDEDRGVRTILSAEKIMLC